MDNKICLGGFHNYIFFYREKFGYLQRELAAIIGISRQTLCDIENEKQFPNYKTIAKLLFVFDCKFEDLFYYEVHYV